MLPEARPGRREPPRCEEGGAAAHAREKRAHAWLLGGGEGKGLGWKMKSSSMVGRPKSEHRGARGRKLCRYRVQGTTMCSQETMTRCAGPLTRLLAAIVGFPPSALGDGSIRATWQTFRYSPTRQGSLRACDTLSGAAGALGRRPSTTRVKKKDQGARCRSRHLLLSARSCPVDHYLRKS